LEIGNFQNMSTFDIILLAIIGGFGLFGLWFGFIHTLGSLIGTIIGAYFASRWYEGATEWLIGITGWGENFSRVLIFIVLFFIINRLVGFLFWIVDKFLSFITRLPFIGGINRLLGMVLGLVEGAVVLGITFFFISRFPLGAEFMAKVGESVVVPPLVKMTSILWPLLPDALRLLQSTVSGLL